MASRWIMVAAVAVLFWLIGWPLISDLGVGEGLATLGLGALLLVALPIAIIAVIVFFLG